MLATVVAPAQSAAVCSVGKGVGADLVFEVESGLANPSPVFDSNGNGVFLNGDANVIGILTDAVGKRAVVTGISGGSGPNICPPPKIPKSIQTTTGQTMVCVDPDPPGAGAGPGANRPFDRVWRRIINPPIR